MGVVCFLSNDVSAKHLDVSRPASLGDSVGQVFVVAGGVDIPFPGHVDLMWLRSLDAEEEDGSQVMWLVQIIAPWRSEPVEPGHQPKDWRKTMRLRLPPSQQGLKAGVVDRQAQRLQRAAAPGPEVAASGSAIDEVAASGSAIYADGQSASASEAVDLKAASASASEVPDLKAASSSSASQPADKTSTMAKPTSVTWRRWWQDKCYIWDESIKEWRLQ